ncbi:MAG TPA: hypothetical protein VFC39_11670 [Acidobacteriaceae bacterium]|nr:hypothetical protein [Acidobacteriaceae bacterium]
MAVRAVEVPHSCAKNKSAHEWATPAVVDEWATRRFVRLRKKAGSLREWKARKATAKAGVIPTVIVVRRVAVRAVEVVWGEGDNPRISLHSREQAEYAFAMLQATPSWRQEDDRTILANAAARTEAAVA